MRLSGKRTPATCRKPLHGGRAGHKLSSKSDNAGALRLQTGADVAIHAHLQQSERAGSEDRWPAAFTADWPNVRLGKWAGAVALASGIACASVVAGTTAVAAAETTESSASSSGGEDSGSRTSADVGQSSDSDTSDSDSSDSKAADREERTELSTDSEEADGRGEPDKDLDEDLDEEVEDSEESATPPATSKRSHATDPDDVPAEDGSEPEGVLGRGDEADSAEGAETPSSAGDDDVSTTGVARQTTPSSAQTATAASTTVLATGVADSPTPPTPSQVSLEPAPAATATAAAPSEDPVQKLTFFSMLEAIWREFIRKSRNSAPTLPAKIVTITIPAGAAASDPIAFGGTDPDGDELTYSVAAKGTRTGPKYGTVTIDQATGTFTYDPDDSLTGTFTDTFTVTLTDSGSRWQGVLSFLNRATTSGVTSKMSVVVEPANQIPKSVADAFSVIADSPVIGNVLANDHDPEGQPLTATLISNPTHGSVNFHRDGSFTYTPEADFTGTDQFSYVAFDGAATSMVTAVTLMVAAVPASKTPSIGVQGLTWWSGLSDADTDRALDMAKSAGVTSMRLDISWYVVEYNEGTYDFSWIDPLVHKMVERNISVLGMLYDTPSWLSGSTNPHAAPTTATSIDLFSEFAAAAAQHYLGYIDTWEIWNEPNIPRFWAEPDPAAYAALLRAVYPAIKAVSGTATVIAGGLSPDSSGIDPLAFVQEMYDAGAGGSFDAIAMHPYGFPQLPSLTSVEAVYNVMAANGDGAKQIWLTEVGAPTGTSPWAVSEEEQAQAVAMFVDFARYNHYVGPIYLYSLLDTGTDPADPEQNFGLIRRDFTPKEAWGIWL